MGDFPAGILTSLPDITPAGILALMFIAMFTGRLVTSTSMAKAYEALESRANVAEQREKEANARTEVALRVVEMQGKQLDIVMEQSQTMLNILQALPYAGGGKRDDAE